MCNHDELMARREGIKQVQQWLTAMTMEPSPAARRLAAVEIEKILNGFNGVIEIKLQAPENGEAK